jgi:hypothetical protein
LLEGLQRRVGAPAAMCGEHPLSPEVLAQGVVTEGGLQLVQGPLRLPDPQQRVDVPLVELCPALLKARDRGRRPVAVGDRIKGPAPPQRACLFAPTQGPVGTMLPQQDRRVLEQSFEAQRIDLVGRHHEAVATGLGDEH